MKTELESNEKNREAGEEQLRALIKQAGAEARRKKSEVMAQHFNKLRDIIAEAVSHKQGSLPT